MYLMAFYSPILPMGILWTLFGLIFKYLVDKYNILRRQSVKYSMSSELATEMTEMLEFVLVIYCVIVYSNTLGWNFDFSDFCARTKLLGTQHLCLYRSRVGDHPCCTSDGIPQYSYLCHSGTWTQWWTFWRYSKYHRHSIIP